MAVARANVVQGTGWTVDGSTAAVTIGSDLGYVKDGIRITPSVDLYLVGEAVEQLTLPVKAFRVSETIEISFTLLEATLANIKLVEDIDNATAGAGPITLDWGDNQFIPTENALVVTGVVPGATRYVRTVTFPKAVLTSPAEIAFTKTEETALNATYTALYSESDTYAAEISDATS